jgi:hypothetical protein
MKKSLFLCLGLGLLFIFGCGHKPTVPPTLPPVSSVPPTVIVPPVVNTSPTTPTVFNLDSITAIASKSLCISYSWKNRGLAPKSYIKGMAIAYAKEVCHPGVASYKAYLPKDALNRYGVTASGLNTYALLMGSGMRESSGQYCTGKDASASNTGSSTAEAGMFQTSYNAMSAHPDLMPLMIKFKTGADCNNIFKEGVTCSASNLKNWGTGSGLEFQKMSKDCPQFAVEVGAITLRTLYNHYGPLINKAAEIVPYCVAMLSEVERYVKSNPDICKQL